MKRFRSLLFVVGDRRHSLCGRSIKRAGGEGNPINIPSEGHGTAERKNCKKVPGGTFSFLPGGLTNVPSSLAFVHNADSGKGKRMLRPTKSERAGKGGKEERTRGLRGPRVDVEEFRSDGKSKGPVRERPGPFDV